MVEVESRRGWVREPARLGDIEPGTVFIPFHYGYWDHPGRRRAANELTISEWDPVSKQPYVKFAAVRLRKIEAGLVGKVEQAATHALDEGKQLADRLAENVSTKLGEILARGKGVVGVGPYLAAVREDEARLAAALDRVAGQLAMEPEMGTMCRLLASWSREHMQALAPIAARYGMAGAAKGTSPSLPKWPPLPGPRLLADLRELWLLASAVALDWTVLERAARAMRDDELAAVCTTAAAQTDRQLAWLRTTAERIAPQALVTFEAATAPPQTPQDQSGQRN